MQSLRFSVLATLLVVAFAGCDNTAPITGGGGDANISSTEDAAVSIANALSLEGGGALDAVASASELAVVGSSSAQGGGVPPGCINEHAFDEGTSTWTRFIECEWGRPEGLFYTLFSRTGTFQFLDGDAPVQFPEQADAVNFDIIDGEGLRIAPGFIHELLDVGADLHVANIHADLVTVNGTYDRAATDTLYTRNAERTLAYELAMTLTDIKAPPRSRDEWPRAVSGTIEGTYHAFITFARGDAYEEVEISKVFTIVFGDGDVRDAIITIDGRDFRADIQTGQVEGIN